MTKSKLLQRIAALVTAMGLLAASTSLTGCGKTVSAEDNAMATEPKALAVVLGAHANSQPLNLASQAVTDAVSETIFSEGYLSVISDTGSPIQVQGLGGSFNVDKQYQGNRALVTKAQNAAVSSVLDKMSHVRADSPEVDTLGALTTAVRTLESAPENSSKEILVIDTGFSTTGLMNFNQNLLSADPQAVADTLAEKQAIPDLSGIKVTFQQLGDVAAPQNSLSPAQKQKLIDIWKSIITNGGGKFSCSDEMPGTEVSSEELPPVTPITLPAETPVSFKAETAEEDLDVLSDKEKPVYLGEDQFQFLPDSDRFADEAKAKSSIQPIADYLKAHQDIKLLLVGQTASANDQNSPEDKDLSLRRAQAVQAVLKAMGIPEERTLTAGLGCSGPWYTSGAGVDSALSASNRRVTLLDASSDMAQKIINEPD